MNINILFSIVFSILIAIFVGFKPLDIKKQEFTDVPLFQVSNFTLYELDKNGLITLMKGEEARRYSDKYEVIKVDYTDNSKQLISNMRANSGIYEDKHNVLKLSGDVFYNRGDGLVFNTEEATYNKSTLIAQSEKNYVLHRGSNEIKGSSFKYNKQLNTIESKNIKAKYQLEEDLL